MDGRWTRARTRKDAKQGETERGGRFAKVSGIYRLKTGEEEEEEQTQQTRHRRAVRSGAGRDFSAINKRARGRAGGRGAAATAVNYGCWWVGAGDSKFSKSLLDEATVRAGPGAGRISAEEEEVSLSQNSLRSAGCAAVATKGRSESDCQNSLGRTRAGYPLSPLHPLGRARPRPPVRPASFPFFAFHLRSFFAAAH